MKITGITDWTPSAGKPSQPPPVKEKLLHENEDGLFSQSWFPICLSTEVQKGEVIGKSFLDGQVAVFRGKNGKAKVVSSYCPHMGADMSNGFVQGNNLQCPFHLWEYDQTGQAVKTAIGDKPPPNACLFNFPTVERWGLIWAFNGEEPLWEIPDMAFPDDELLIKTYEVRHVKADPWVVCCNTLDLQHFVVLHLLKLRQSDYPSDDIRWSEHSVTYDLKAYHWGDIPIDYTLGIFGTSIFYQESYIDGKWFSIIAPLGMPQPGYTIPYFVCATHKGEGLEKAEEINDYVQTLENKFYDQDERALNNIHFRQGLLTKRDKQLAKFFDHLKRQPRAHPSYEYIR